MRLLQTATLQFAEFWDGDVPPYAILSHTWDKDEVAYLEMKCPTNETKQKAGFVKIQRYADLAKSKGYSYVWVDTCCIDKSSSAELSEAINSMYQWYKRSKVCFTYLPDFTFSQRDLLEGLDPWNKGEEIEFRFNKCRWVTRGWTLQELIAPARVLFYGQNFNYIGDKRSLTSHLSRVTGIPHEVLNSCDPSTASVAQRMSWASKRKTTRAEDVAYCLMGIFNVNMPLLYGEGNKAFVRLQEEIMKSSDDHTIFAWRATVDSRHSYRGLLARSPEEFYREKSSHFTEILSSEFYDDAPYSVTNKGICMAIPLAPWREVKSYFLKHQSLDTCRRFGYEVERAGYAEPTRSFEDDNFYVALLNCTNLSVASADKQLGLGLILVAVSGQNQYARVDADLLVSHLDPRRFEFKTIYVRQNVQLARDYYSPRLSAFKISHDLNSWGISWGFSSKISAAALDKPLEFDNNVFENTFELSSLKSQDGLSKVLLLRLEATYQDLTRVVSVILKWDSQSGAYSFQAHHDAATVDDMFTESKSNQYGQIEKKSLTIPLHNRLKLVMDIEMYTRLVEDRPVINVYIKGGQ